MKEKVNVTGVPETMWETIISGEYQNYYEKMYAHRGEA